MWSEMRTNRTEEYYPEDFPADSPEDVPVQLFAILRDLQNFGIIFVIPNSE